MAPSKILLIDDSPSIRTIVKLFLMNRAAEFVEAKDGAEGLGVATATGAAAVDLVIADFNMPVMDGLTFVRKLRDHGDLRLKQLPVILLTANKEPEIRAQAEAAGAHFAQKPVSREQLNLTVDKLLPKPSGARG